MTTGKAFKQRVYNLCHQSIQEKINLLKQAQDDLRESSKNETKSSAGDKYETARAMLQIEIDNITKQLNESYHQKAALEQTNINTNSDKIIKGSLVLSDKGYFFLSTALGKIITDNIPVMAISPQSPLGIKLTGLTANATAQINNTIYTILQVI